MQTVFGTDPAAQAWLTQAMTAINELWQVASVVPDPAVTAGYSLPDPVSFAFSVMEALYARGFASAQDIVNLPAADFQQALTGTVAYDFAGSLYTEAQSTRHGIPQRRVRRAAPSSRSTRTARWSTASRRHACRPAGRSPTCRRC